MKSTRGKSRGDKQKSDKKNTAGAPRIGKSKANKVKKVGPVKSKRPDSSLKVNKTKSGEPLPTFQENIRLNKFLSNAGICSRREADTLISTGVVTVNGKVVTEMGYRVKPTDVVRYDGIGINPETKRYVLLNKPKDFVLASDSPLKKSALSLVAKACKEPLFPVGRMDKDTSGLVLFTNDTDMEKKLTHPKVRASKIYHVTLDKNLEQDDLSKLTTGMYIADSMYSAKDASFIKGKSPNEVGIEIDSNKNNLVKLMFEKLGYQVVKLDRVQFAGLTKKDLPRGNYRHLSEKEVAFLKMK
ncbi:MAG: pseudouridine synthase [Brumimicrobium sp.]|nr:pseudouridine synthase [Brumimicrobium sp.]